MKMLKNGDFSDFRDFRGFSDLHVFRMSLFGSAQDDPKTPFWPEGPKIAKNSQKWPKTGHYRGFFTFFGVGGHVWVPPK